MAAELRAERPPAGTNGSDDIGFKRELVQLIRDRGTRAQRR